MCQHTTLRLTSITGILTLLWGLAASASAQLIAADSYNNGGTDYSAGFGNTFNGQSSTSAIGFTDPWGGGSTSGNTHPDFLTLEHPSVSYESGGKGKFTPNAEFSDFERRFQHELAPFVPPADDFFYMSHLVNTGPEIANGATEGYALVGFGSFADQGRLESTQDFLFGAFLGFAADGVGNVDLVIRSRTGTSGVGSVTDEILLDASTGDAVEDLTHLVVMKLTYTGGDKIDWWLNPSDLTSESAMTSSSVSSGTIDGFQLGSASDMNRLTVNTFGYDRSFFFDESRLGYDLTSVAGEPPVIENADFDGDGDVDGRDYLIWQEGFGIGTTQPEGDANSSGAVDGEDLAVWQNQHSVVAASSSVTSIPEPSTLLLTLLGHAYVLGSRRRRL